jgi:hypothetical protein
VRPAAIRAGVGGGARTTDDMAVLGAWKTIIWGLHLHTLKRILQLRVHVAFQSALTRMQQPRQPGGRRQRREEARGGGGARGIVSKLYWKRAVNNRE